MSKIIDEHSFDNPKNHANGKWKRLVPLSPKDPLYLKRKFAVYVVFCVYLEPKTSREKVHQRLETFE